MVQPTQTSSEHSGRPEAFLSCGFIEETVPCELEEHPIRNHPVAQFVLQEEVILQRSWVDETAHSDYRPLPARGVTHAYGQCVPTSVLLFERLSQEFCDEVFSIESGFVYERVADLRSPIYVQSHTHVWLQWLPSDSERNLTDFHVIDLTASQLSRRQSNVIQSARKLVSSGLLYQSLRRFYDLDSFYRQFEVGEPGVRSRVERLRQRCQQVSEARAAIGQAGLGSSRTD